jgi:hypothetical protein
VFKNAIKKIAEMFPTAAQKALTYFYVIFVFFTPTDKVSAFVFVRWLGGI